MTTPPTVVITVEGGAADVVCANVPVRVLIADLDQDENTVLLPGGDHAACRLVDAEVRPEDVGAYLGDRGDPPVAGSVITVVVTVMSGAAEAQCADVFMNVFIADLDEAQSAAEDDVIDTLPDGREAVTTMTYIEARPDITRAYLAAAGLA